MSKASKALIHKKPSGSAVDGAIPAVASAFVPGLGQLINGQGNKALGVFAVWGVCGLGFLGAIPLVGAVAGTVGAATWIYGVADGYLTGKKKG
jgi:TM2 domain-containing membrane protein YozV